MYGAEVGGRQDTDEDLRGGFIPETNLVLLLSVLDGCHAACTTIGPPGWKGRAPLTAASPAELQSYLPARAQSGRARSPVVPPHGP